MFWISWMAPVRRARVHRSDCRHCNNGFGKSPSRPCYSSRTGWRGPYTTVADAEHILALIVAVDGYTDTGTCACMKAQPTVPALVSGGQNI